MIFLSHKEIRYLNAKLPLLLLYGAICGSSTSCRTRQVCYSFQRPEDPAIHRSARSCPRPSSVRSGDGVHAFSPAKLPLIVSHSHRTISWNASGSQIATGATDKTIRIWNPERKESRSQIKLDGHSHAVEKVLFNPVKEFELASCGDSTIKFWDTRNRICTSKLDVGGDTFTLSWSVDGSVLLAGLKVSTAFQAKSSLLLTGAE